MVDGKVIFEPVKMKKVSEAIEESIKELILDGKLKPGEKLPPQIELSDQFGVSIVTIREALRGLEAIGLIVKKKGKYGGTFIAETQTDTIKETLQTFFTWKEVTARHLIETRMIIEPYAVRRAIQVMTPVELEEIRENVRYCEDKLKSIKDEISMEDFFDIELTNIEFHRLLAKATHNPVLALTIDCVMDFLHNFEKIILQPNKEYSDTVVKGHREILNLIESGDMDSAEKLMIEHIKQVEDDIWNK